MNKEEILKMSAGRELDALIAEKIMGWERDFQCWKDPNGRLRTIEPTSFGSFEPSTDISAAWEVLEKIKGNGECQIYWWADHWETWVGKGDNVKAPTAPEAICKAALLSVMDS